MPFSLKSCNSKCFGYPSSEYILQTFLENPDPFPPQISFPRLLAWAFKPLQQPLEHVVSLLALLKGDLTNAQAVILNIAGQFTSQVTSFLSRYKQFPPAIISFQKTPSLPLPTCNSEERFESCLAGCWSRAIDSYYSLRICGYRASFNLLSIWQIKNFASWTYSKRSPLEQFSAW